MTIRELTLIDIMEGNGECLSCGHVCSIDCYCLFCRRWACTRCSIPGQVLPHEDVKDHPVRAHIEKEKF